MKKVNFKYLIFSLLLLNIQAISTASSPFYLDKTTSKITILGTSSVHDWEIKVSDFNCDAAIQLDENKQASVSDVHVVCEVKNIESDNRIMTNKTYKALDGDKHPQIQFKASEIATVSPGSEASIKGKLTIAGQTREISLPFTLVAENGQMVKIAGKVPLKMSDFKIEPPTAMMGALKTGDAIEIAYEIILKTK